MSSSENVHPANTPNQIDNAGAMYVSDKAIKKILLKGFSIFGAIFRVAESALYCCLLLALLSTLSGTGFVAAFASWMVVASVLLAVGLVVSVRVPSLRRWSARNFNACLSVSWRFMLGATESDISPGFSLPTSIWHKPSEHASRHALWFAGNGVALMFGSLLGYATGHAQGTIAAWRVSNACSVRDMD